MPVYSLPGFSVGTGYINNMFGSNVPMGSEGYVNSSQPYGIYHYPYSPSPAYGGWRDYASGNYQPAPFDKNTTIGLGNYKDGQFSTQPRNILGVQETPGEGTLGWYESQGVGKLFKKQGGNVGNGTTIGPGLKGISGEQWANIGQNAIQFTGATIGAFGPVKSQGELYADAGQSTGYGTGYNYVKQNTIDEHGEMSDLRNENTANTLKTTSAGIGLGAAIGTGVGVAAGAGAGSIAGPIGAAAGAVVGLGIGLFGGANRRRKLRARIYNAQQNAQRMNQFASSSAQTDYLTNSYYQENGDMSNQQLYSARYGKDTQEPLIPDNSRKGKVREFNRRLSLPNMKEE